MLELERIGIEDLAHFHKQYVRKGRPVVIENGARDWPALGRWSPSFFKDHFAGHPIITELSRAGSPPSEPRAYLSNRYYVKRPIDEAIAAMSGSKGDGGYITYAKFLHERSELLKDVRPLHQELGFPDGLSKAVCRRLSLPVGFWLGPAGIVSPAHFDRHENLNVQIYGRKQWTLFSPAENRNLYFNQSDALRVLFSPVDVSNPDYERYPRFTSATGYETVLNAGDTIYVPPGWWHHVRSLDECISLNYWWWSPTALRLATRVSLHLAALYLRRIFKSKDPHAPASMPT